jgi:hypothetical protein
VGGTRMNLPGRVGTAVRLCGVALTSMASTGLWRPVLVLVSTALAVSATLPYVRRTIAGVTKPRLVTWVTWSLLTALAAAASLADADYPSAVFAMVGTVATAAVVVAGWCFGDRTMGWLDVCCLALVVAGLGLWQITNRPALAVGTACLIDFLGLIPTIAHAWTHPHEETPATFILVAAAGATTAMAAWGHWTVTALGYPGYVAISTAMVAALIWWRRPPRSATR